MSSTKVLLFILSIISEYILIIKLKIQSIFIKSPPTFWKNGNKSDVILIPGVHSNFLSLSFIGNALNKLGYIIHTLPKLKNNTQLIEKSIPLLEDYLKLENLSNVTLVCHSKGGLLAKYFLETSPYAKKVSKVISIATPFHGSVLAKFVDKDCCINSAVILKNNLNKSDNKNIYNFYPLFDNHVIPNKNLILSGAHNYKINIIGHTRILFSERTLKVISKII